MTKPHLFDGAERRAALAASNFIEWCTSGDPSAFRTPSLALICSGGLDSDLPWDDTPLRIPFASTPGFEDLVGRDYPCIEGDTREFLYGFIDGTPFLVVSGRISLYEGEDHIKTRRMVRLLIDMPVHVGLKRIVTASMVGSCTQRVDIGDVVVPSGFVNSGERMTGVGHEGCASLESALCRTMGSVVRETSTQLHTQLVHGFRVCPSIDSHAQRTALSEVGVHVVGSSGQPELECIARHRAVGIDVRGLMICFVNTRNPFARRSLDDSEEDHEAKWKALLNRLILKLI